MPSLLSRVRRRVHAAGERWPVSPRAHAIAAWAALGLFTLIVSTGAAVRLTGSGLGCHDWPNCTDQSLTPQTGHGAIEFSNRLITTPVTIAAIACIVLALLRRPYRRDFTLLGALLLLGVLAQAILGGVTVLTGLNPVTVMAHFLLSMVTIVLAVTLVWRVQRDRRAVPTTPQRDPLVVWAVRALVALGAVVVVLGTMTTASGPHAGGEGTNDIVNRLTWFGNDTFRHLIAAHSRIAAAFGVLAVALWFWALRRKVGRDLQLPLTGVCVMVAVAGLIGNLQYHVLDYPAGLVWAHVTVAAALWGTLCWAFIAAGRPAPARRPDPRRERELTAV